jgi:hypothetical protein
MVSLEVIAILFSGIGISASLVYYANILRNANKARQRELIFLRTQSYSKEYTDAYTNICNQQDWKTPQDWFEKYGRTQDPIAFSSFLYICNIFNLAGVLLKEKEADMDLIFQLYHPNSIIPVWEHFESVINYVREDHKYSEYLEPFEFLYHKAKKKYPDIPPIRVIV